jgi:hypothetical protein
MAQARCSRCQVRYDDFDNKPAERELGWCPSCVAHVKRILDHPDATRHGGHDPDAEGGQAGHKHGHGKKS